MIYEELRESKSENAYSTDIEKAFEKAEKYDAMRENLLGLRNIAWAKEHSPKQQFDKHHGQLFTYVSNALLSDDSELLSILTFSVVTLG